MKANAAHPTYQAMIELGRAQKTIFLARYLRGGALQREMHEGLNVVESWNRVNAVIFYERVVPAHPAGRTGLRVLNL